MKTVSLTFAILCFALGAFGQGKILFGNDSLHLYTWYGVGNGQFPPVPIPLSPLPDGLSLVVALYAGTSAGSLSLQTAITLSGTDYLSPGRQANKNVTLSGIAGGAPVNFQIVLVDNVVTRPATITGSYGWDSNNAFLGATYYFTSGLFTAVPGTSLSYPNIATAASQSTWAPGAWFGPPTPEPSSLALFGLGAGLLLLRRCRQ